MLALEFFPQSDAAKQQPAATASGINLQIFGSAGSAGMQQLNNQAALKVLEALEWLGKAKESCYLSDLFCILSSCTFSLCFSLFLSIHDDEVAKRYRMMHRAARHCN